MPDPRSFTRRYLRMRLILQIVRSSVSASGIWTVNRGISPPTFHEVQTNIEKFCASRLFNSDITRRAKAHVKLNDIQGAINLLIN